MLLWLNCPWGAIRGKNRDPYKEEALLRYLSRTLCTAFSLAFVSSLDKGNLKSDMDEQRLITKSFAGCFQLFNAGSQSSLASVWISFASYQLLSLVNLSRSLHWYLMRYARNSRSVRTPKTESGSWKHDIRLPSKKLFSREDSTHLLAM